ncbi:MAG: DNA-binding response regulator [Balneolaceae bacterium]|nr:MAG: DNA-binding response regulator [Balneolaceae bacterium]
MEPESHDHTQPAYRITLYFFREKSIFIFPQVIHKASDMSIGVLIVESQDLYRAGAEAVLRNRNKFQVHGTATNGKELLKLFRLYPESVCLVSSATPDTNIHELMTALREISSEPKVVIMTLSTDLKHLEQSLKAGVKGYISKNCKTQELIDMIEGVNEGNQLFGKTIAQIMAGSVTSANRKPKVINGAITKREQEILKFIVEGYTSSEIAEHLFISARTVETHRSNLMNKLGIKNTAALVRFAMEQDSETKNT